MIQKVEMDYCHDCNVVGNKPEAYERLLLDFIRGNSTLFTRWDEIEAAWKIIDSIKNHVIEPVIYQDFEGFLAIVNSIIKEETL
jgi:glucose-6-phosphate 1-dehydrogenase